MIVKENNECVFEHVAFIKGNNHFLLVESRDTFCVEYIIILVELPLNKGKNPTWTDSHNCSWEADVT